MDILCMLILGGAVVGLLSGLFGVGGTIIIVPLLNLLFSGMGIPENLVQHLAVGTAPSTILVTSLATFIAHVRMGSMLWDVWKKMVSGIVIGSVAGAVLAHRIQGSSLELVFGIMIVVMAVQMIIGFKPRPHSSAQAYSIPVSIAIGVLSSLTGVAGSLQLIIFLAWAGYAWCDCVSTAAALSLPITLTATISYMILGWGIDGLPDFSLGYVYLPGTFGLMIPSMLMAVAGAGLAHWSKLPARLLKRAFGVFGLCVGITLLIRLI